jgi:hypothetical protein
MKTAIFHNMLMGLKVKKYSQMRSHGELMNLQCNTKVPFHD